MQPFVNGKIHVKAHVGILAFPTFSYQPDEAHIVYLPQSWKGLSAGQRGHAESAAKFQAPLILPREGGLHVLSGFRIQTCVVEAMTVSTVRIPELQ